MSTFAPKQVLVPVDFSDFSAYLRDVAMDFAEQWGANLTFLNIVEPISGYTLAMAGLAADNDIIERVEEGARAEMEKFLAPVSKRAEKAGLKVQGRVVPGLPVQEIKRVAEKVKADLILTTTHGRTGIAHAIIGSVAERLVRESPIHVMVLRAPLLLSKMPKAKKK